jgi:hypothetical protein
VEDHDKRPFLLTEGGPLYRIEKRVGLIKSRTLEVRRRALISILFTWVPLFLLCAAQGTAFGHGLTMPFLKDFSAYTRFLIAIPLLLVAETIIGPRIAEAAEHFVTSGLVMQEDFHRFDEAVRKGLLLRDSVIAEIIIVILSYAITIGSLQGFTMSVSNWHFIHSDGGVSASWAHWWVVAFCSPPASIPAPSVVLARNSLVSVPLPYEESQSRVVSYPSR